MVKRIRNCSFVLLVAIFAATSSATAKAGGDPFCSESGQDCGDLSQMCDFYCYIPYTQYQDYEASYCYEGHNEYNEPVNCYYCQCVIAN